MRAAPNRDQQDRSRGTGMTAVTATRSKSISEENRIKTFRWLFIGNLIQLLIFFAVPRSFNVMFSSLMPRSSIIT